MPDFVNRVNHVFLRRFLQLFRTYRGQNEFVHWIGRFEIAQKRLLASWADLIEMSDLPDVGTAEFLAALTERKARISGDPSRTNHHKSASTTPEQFSTLREFDAIGFLIADLNEQQRERFVSSMSIGQIAMPQYTYLQVKHLFLELFCVSSTGVAGPNIAHCKRP